VFSLTQMSLVSYLLRVVKDVVIRNPRFRRALGDVSLTSTNAISFGNLQVLIKDVNTDGTRLSPDYFMCTMVGRAILAQITDKDGLFVEWIAETDASMQTPVAGVYYFNIDSVDEQTRDVGLTIESYRWCEGQIKNASGTKLAFRSGIDATQVVVIDPTLSPSPNSMLNAPPGPRYEAAQGYIYLLSRLGGVTIGSSQGVLVPNVDYWIEAQQTMPLISPTIFGVQQVPLPVGFQNISLIDQDGWMLRPNIDYILTPTGDIQFSAWTPSGVSIYIKGTVQLDPTIPSNLCAAENTINVTLQPWEKLAEGQVFVSTQDGDNIQVLMNSDGSISLAQPLPPGGFCRYEMRVLVGRSNLVAKKSAVNKDILPGLRIAIGDQVVVGDQCAIIVSPKQTETYHVYGSKPGVMFTLDVKSNDPTTSDEIAKMLMQELLIRRRDTLESDGLTIYEATSSFASAVRDDSGTAPTHSISLSFTAAADWRIFQPLVTRVTGFNMAASAAITTFQGKIKSSNRYSCLNNYGFIPGYG